LTDQPVDLRTLAGPVVAIVNPRASRLRVPDRRAWILAQVDAWASQTVGQPATVVTVRDGPSMDAAGLNAVRAGAGLVVAIGGDGTVAALTAGLVDSGIPLAILPSGTGNVLAGALGIPDDPLRALRGLADSTRRSIDLGEAILGDRGQVGSVGRIFSVAAGVGWEARVMDATARHHKRRLGRLAYWIAGLGLLGELAPVPYALEIDGERLDLEATIALVANCGDLVPGLIRPRLPIVPDDGLLDLFVLRVGGIRGGIRGMLDLLGRTEVGGSPSGDAFRARARRIRIRARPDQPRQVDGDGCGPGPLEVIVRPGALDVLVPRRHP
jgi:diacylglycerol kinase family enzyme